MRKLVLILFPLAAVALSGCATQVSRVDVKEEIDVSGRWNDTDSRLVSEEMISDAIKHPWHKQFKRNHDGKAPVVIVGTVQNRSHEHINVQTFTKDLERALINTGEVEFVASSAEREELRDERKDQAVNATEATAKMSGAEAGADYMLKGSINTIQDASGGKNLMFYQVNLELIHIESNKKVWIGEKKIKKMIKQSRFGL